MSSLSSVRDLERKIGEETYVLVICRVREGKEADLMRGLADFMRSVRELHADNFRVLLGRGLALITIPFSVYTRNRSSFIEHIESSISNIVELVLPEIRLAMFDVDSLSSALKDIESVAGTVLTSTLLFRAGLVYGRELAKATSTLGAVTPGEKVKVMLELLRALHLYKNYELISLSVDKIELAFETESDTVYSHFVRGVITGVISSILERAYICSVKKIIGSTVLIELKQAQ